MDEMGFELAHIGINGTSEAEALGIAELFAAAFGFEVKNGSSSVFAGSAVEVMKSPFKGRNGHIAIRANSVDDAKSYLESKGFGFDEASAKTDEAGNTIAIYLEKEFGGFAVHLLKKK